jgi:uncharacterized phage protein (TIGR02216 family)
MTAGLGTLRLSPAHFWSMTPRELAAALHSLAPHHASPMPPSRDDLAALMTRYPD